MNNIANKREDTDGQMAYWPNITKRQPTPRDKSTFKELQIGLGAGNFLPSISHPGWGIFWQLAGQGFRNYIKQPTRARGKVL